MQTRMVGAATLAIIAWGSFTGAATVALSDGLPEGDRGVVGTAGVEGFQGEQGERGARGATGAKGPAGDRGAKGEPLCYLADISGDPYIPSRPDLDYNEVLNICFGTDL